MAYFRVSSISFLLLWIALLFTCTPKIKETNQILLTTDFVDPLIGTGIATTPSAIKHSVSGSELRGQTYPAVGVPHGMTQWSPQTQYSEKKCLPP